MKFAILLLIVLLTFVQLSSGGRFGSSSRSSSSSSRSSSSSSRSSGSRSSSSSRSSRSGSSSSGGWGSSSSSSGSRSSSIGSRSGSVGSRSSSLGSRSSSIGSRSSSIGSRSSSIGSRSSSIGSRSSSIGSRSSSIGSRSSSIGSRSSSVTTQRTSIGSRISSIGSRSSSIGSRSSSIGSRSGSIGSISSIGSRSSSFTTPRSSIGSQMSSIGSRSSSIGSRSGSIGSISSIGSRSSSIGSRSSSIGSGSSSVGMRTSSIGLGSSSIGRRTSSSSSGSSYPKNQWSSGITPRSVSNVQYTNTLKNYGIPSNHQYPKNYGTVYGTSGTSYGSHKTGGSFGSKMKQKLFGSNHGYGSSNGAYSYKSPGYGTNWGTSFGKGKHSIGRYKYGKKSKKGFSKKALGLGVAAGFVGGAALGVAGTAATYGVYHRYNKYKQLMYRNQYGRSWDNDPMYGGYYSNYYTRNQCLGGCFGNSHCEWGFCECIPGFTRKWGRCERDWGIASYRRPSSFDPFQTCTTSRTCLEYDMNLVCNTELSVQGVGKCQCRQDMKWNTQTMECQLYLDVDCSRFTYDTPPSRNVLSAVDRTMVDLDGRNDPSVFNSNDNIENVMANSLLSSVDPSTFSQDDIREAFCRDVDSFSHEFRREASTCVGKNVIAPVCAVIYDEEDCMGWHGNRGKQISVGNTDFGGRWSWMYGNDMWKYRNDIESVSVRAGCYLTVYVDNKFQDESAVIVAGSTQRNVNLEEEEGYAFFEENIESVRCACD